jgi:hypothetical protein
LAAFHSPFTSVKNIELKGVRLSERERLQVVEQSMRGVPAMHLNAWEIEGKFLAQSRIKSAEFSRSILGKGVLKLVYRSPVLKLAGLQHTYLDDSGIFFNDPEVRDPIHTMKMDPNMQISLMTLTGIIDRKKIVEFAGLLRKTIGSRGYGEGTLQVEVQSTGSLCLNMPRGRVVFGTSENLPEKVEALKQVLDGQPNIFNEASELNLMSPGHMYKLPRKQAK